MRDNRYPVARARAELGDSIDDRIFPVTEAMRLAMTARVIGCKIMQARDRLDAATTQEISEWQSRVYKTEVPTLSELLDARVVVERYTGARMPEVIPTPPMRKRSLSETPPMRRRAAV